MCENTPAVQTTLPLDPRAAGEARRFLRAAICREHAASVLEGAELLVSELVTNGVRHAAPPITLRVACDGSRGLQVSVSDGEPAGPAPREAHDEAESGRGMSLVDYISDDWGVQPHQDGKTVWFTLSA
ncbi:ATP-binding protein [Kineococcus indalonis]|uniref:ATP-binding protein n=1 Tax=Kineococcus indalonis TaxID=2696566 RepID=UPI002B1BDA14|nr:ATP-binding protein [Kineococcus indalonis]